MVAALFVLAGVALSTLGGSDSTSRIPGPGGTDHEGPALIILTCDNISPSPDDTWLSDGIYDAIHHRLAGVAGIFLLGRETAKWYRDYPTPPSEIAAEQNLDFVGECSVRKYPNTDRFLVTFQLLDAEGVTEWSDEYEGDFTADDLFEIQRDIAGKVANAIGAKLTPEEQARSEATPTDNIDAFKAYSIGRHWWNQRTADGLENAIRCFEESVSLDSTFALAYVGLAETYVLTPWYGPFIPTPEARQRAFEAGQRALEIDPMLGEAHTALALAAHTFDWDWEAAEEGYLEAIRLNPGYATTHHWYGVLLAYLGRYEEAIARMRIAVDLEPLSPIINNNVGFIQYYAGRYDDAVEQYLRTLELFPDFGVTHRMLGRVYLKTGRYDLARERLRGTPYLSFVHSAEGEFDEARAVVEQTDTGSLRSRLIAYAGIGDLDRVFLIADSALEIHAPWIIEDPINDPVYEVLRFDPRFEQILRRAGLRD
jgi:TolB-like protein/tetratricopeptide (TPR) repeat protein